MVVLGTGGAEVPPNVTEAVNAALVDLAKLENYPKYPTLSFTE